MALLALARYWLDRLVLLELDCPPMWCDHAALVVRELDSVQKMFDHLVILQWLHVLIDHLLLHLPIVWMQMSLVMECAPEGAEIWHLRCPYR